MSTAKEIRDNFINQTRFPIATDTQIKAEIAAQLAEIVESLKVLIEKLDALTEQKPLRKTT